MHQKSRRIQTLLAQKADFKKADWWFKYLKGAINFYGVGTPDIRKILQQTFPREDLQIISFSEQKQILDDLMSQKYSEEKMAAILFMQLYWKNRITPDEQLKLIDSWFDQEFIWDWNICDWLCVRIITPFINTSDTVALAGLKSWNKAIYLWKARASLVPFAECKNITQYGKIIKKLSIELIKREERFAKTAVGWVMRQYSKHDTDFVKSFLKEYKNYITSEVIKNATKYID